MNDTKNIRFYFTSLVSISILFFSCTVGKLIVEESETKIIDNSLRFYDIKSSMESTVFMYELNGEWQTKLVDKESNHIVSFLWEDVDLMDNGQKYDVTTMGVESMEEYYTAIEIHNKNGVGCLSPEHPDSTRLVEFLKKAIDEHRYKGKSKTYSIVKKSLISSLQDKKK